MNKITVIFLLCICFGCHKAKQTQIKADISLNAIIIPVEINGDTIMMVWDTGATTSAISKQTADKLGIKPSKQEKEQFARTFVIDNSLIDKHSNKPKKIWYNKDTVIHIYSSDYTKIKIGDFLTETFFSIVNIRDSDVIGGNIINKYCWIIDFEKGTVLISDRSIKPVLDNVIDSLELDFVLGRSQSPIFQITLGVDTLKLLFDTGMPHNLEMNYRGNNTLFHFDIVMSARDTMDNTTQKFRDICKHNSTINTSLKDIRITNRWAYCDSILFNNYPITSYIFYRTGGLNPNTDGYLTYSFARRFNVMYYDPYKGKVKFYKLADVESLHKDISIDSLFRLKK